MILFIPFGEDKLVYPYPIHYDWKCCMREKNLTISTSGRKSAWTTGVREFFGPTKTRVSCQDRALAKGFGMKNKPVPRNQSIYYWLKCCMEARSSRIKSSGSALPPGTRPVNHLIRHTKG